MALEYLDEGDAKTKFKSPAEAVEWLTKREKEGDAPCPILLERAVN